MVRFAGVLFGFLREILDAALAKVFTRIWAVQCGTNE
jgi:hypothetical protein